MKKKLLGFLIVLVVIFVFSCAIEIVLYVTDVPQAATQDEGRTISYFEVPSSDGKGYVKIYPSNKRFMEIMRKGEYSLVNIPSPRIAKILKKSYEKNK